MADNNLSNLMEIATEKLRAMVDADTIIGTPLTVGSVTLIPVSKISFGLATGGSDFPTKNSGTVFGGGGGAGMTVSPIAFIAVNGDNVHMMPVYNQLDTIDKAINMAPELIDKVKSLFPAKKNKDNDIIE
ncbi:MAG: sporulation protein YtfJ [Clostridia bacterium]|nr:sporulation protein YtfJ [Clostridia bacterium]